MPEIHELVKNLADQYGRTREALLPILEGIVLKESYLTDTAMVEVAKELDISAADVYGTATFFHYLETRPLGENIIRVCKTITCDMKGKNQIIRAIETTLKIKLGETTPDKKFSLLETNCLGWCHKGPVMLINDTPYTELTPEKANEILDEYINK